MLRNHGVCHAHAMRAVRGARMVHATPSARHGGGRGGGGRVPAHKLHRKLHKMLKGQMGTSHWGNTLHQLTNAQLHRHFTDPWSFGGFGSAGGGGGFDHHHTQGHLDIHECADGAHVITADVPGLDKSMISVLVEEGNLLTIKGANAPADTDATAAATGDSSDDAEAKSKSNGGANRRAGSITEPPGRKQQHRSISSAVRLPRSADTGQITAKVENGVLTITVPQRADAAPVNISVQ